MDIKITNDNTKEILSELDEKIIKALTECGMTAERYAVGLCPYYTGLLRNSITYAISNEAPAISSYKADKGSGKGSYSGTMDDDKEKTMYLGTNVEYAPYVELGTGRRTKGGRQSKWAYKSKDGIKSTTGYRAQPFIRPAIADHGAEYKRIIETELKR